MIVQDNTNKVDSSFGTGQRLQIAATATAMKILSKNIYSRPVEAVLRELGTNAADAHVMVGCGNKPFDVYLPTYQDMTLKVRDYGPGIPPDKVIPIFATYFSSTKTEDNTVVGCLGLGSKSPLAISDQFIVEIWHDGFYYVWNIYKDEEGYPCVPDGKPSLVTPTVEPTGVQITVPISEFREFEAIAVALYRNFDVIPNVYKGTRKIEVARLPKLSTFPSFYSESGYGIFALMGNILYPIDTNISELHNYSDLCSNNRIIIPFNIGELEFSASRESLEYNKRVIRTLKDKYKTIIAEMSVSIQKEIDTAKNAYTAVCNFSGMVIPNNLKRDIFNKLIYNGKLLNSYFYNGDESNFDDSLWADPQKKEAFLTRYSYYNKKRGTSSYRVSVNKGVKIYYNDQGLKKGVLSRFMSLGDGSCYLIHDSVNIDKWCELNFFDKGDLIGLSTIKMESVSSSTYESRKTAGLFSVCGGNIQKDFWRSLDVAPDFAYYFTKSGDKILVGGKEIFPEYWNRYTSLGILPTDHPIVGVSKSYLKNYKDWTKMEDVMIPALEAKREEVELAYANKYTELVKLIPYLSDGELKTKLVSIQANATKMEAWHGIYNLFQIPLKDRQDLILKKEMITDKYPMLKFVLDRWENPTVKEVQEYIASVDALTVSKKEEEENVVL